MKTVAFYGLWAAIILFCFAQAGWGATGCASRRVAAPDQTIVGVLFDLAVGGAKGLLDDAEPIHLQPGSGRIRRVAETVQIRIDGRPVSGWPGWLRAGARIAGYAMDWADRGRVDVWRADRHYTIRDGFVTVRVERIVIERGPIGRSIPICVAVEISAVETPAGVIFRGHATGTKNGCLGARAISSGLAEALGQIEATGRRLYYAGHRADIGDAADRAISAFRMR